MKKRNASAPHVPYDLLPEKLVASIEPFEGSGVYRIWRGGRLLYIGATHKGTARMAESIDRVARSLALDHVHLTWRFEPNDKPFSAEAKAIDAEAPELNISRGEPSRDNWQPEKGHKSLQPEENDKSAIKTWVPDNLATRTFLGGVGRYRK